MSFLAVAVQYYPQWHYTKGLRGVYVVWMNYLWFFYHLFSIELLLGTLFAPWKRLDMSYRDAAGHVQFKEIAGTLIVNTLMRLVGLVVRLTTIFLGVAVLAFVFVAGIAAFLVWVAMPAVLISLLALGIKFMVS